MPPNKIRAISGGPQITLSMAVSILVNSSTAALPFDLLRVWNRKENEVSERNGTKQNRTKRNEYDSALSFRNNSRHVVEDALFRCSVLPQMLRNWVE